MLAESPSTSRMAWKFQDFHQNATTLQQHKDYPIKDGEEEEEKRTGPRNLASCYNVLQLKQDWDGAWRSQSNGCLLGTSTVWMVTEPERACTHPYSTGGVDAWSSREWSVVIIVHAHLNSFKSCRVGVGVGVWLRRALGTSPHSACCCIF